MIKTFKCAVIAIVMVLSFANSYSQADTGNMKSYEDLSLKDLLNVKIVSASKKSELLFDAPLSASVVTREEIRKAGSTSIMEALRLVPGMIVREESNGNYDIHLRGMDNVPPNAPFDITSNTTTLVMIDNRPVYSYLRGGTFWETLPVDINDVERIEVIRGPAAALYGPNAVNGVINIITREVQKPGLYAVANSRQGTNETFIENASLGYVFNKKLSIITSGNYQYRQRSQTSYFEFYRNKLIESPDNFITYNNDTITNINEFYPQPELAMKKYAGNVFINFYPSEKIKYALTAGFQHSIVQKISTDNGITPLSTSASASKYVDLRANIYGLSTQLSYNQGTQTTRYEAGNKYDFNIVDANIEYSYTKGNFLLKPAFNYRSAVYDDTKYSNILHRAGIFNNRGRITSQSPSLRSEYKFLYNKLRLVAGVSANKFNYPDATYFAYEFAATYKVNSKHLFRAVYSQSPRSSNVYDTYVDHAITYYPVSDNNYIEIAVVGDKNLKLLTANMLEFGYRGSINKSLFVDVELFDIRAKNFNTIVQNKPIVEFDGGDTVHETPLRITNLPLTLRQQGITISLTYNSKLLQVKPFITVQHTKMKDYAPYLNTADAGNPGNEQNNIYSGLGTTATLNNTPTVYGGASVNYLLSSKFNINIGAYYYSSQTYLHFTNVLFNDGVRGVDNIPSKLILNANISYEAVKGLHFFCSAKNLLNNETREFFRTDDIPFMLLGGINYAF